MHSKVVNPVKGMHPFNTYFIRRYCGILVTVFSLFSNLPAGFPQEGPSDSRSSNGYKFRQLTVDNGLSQNMISSIFQDHMGFMWFGTKDGLNMYDGYRLRQFKGDPANPYSLSDNYITVIHEDPLNRIWIGTFDGGLHYYDHRTDRFINFSHDPGDENSISHNHITAIRGDPSGKLWIGTQGGGMNLLICRDMELPLDKSSYRIARYDGPENDFPEAKARINTIAIDRNNQLWIGTPNYLFVFEPSNGRGKFRRVDFQRFYGPSQSASLNPDTEPAGGNVIIENAAGELLVGNKTGLFKLDRHEQVFREYRPAGKRLPVTNIMTASTLRHQGKEKIWLGSRGTIFILEPASGHYNWLSNETDQNMGLQRGWFTSLFTDRSGTIWLGSNGYGLSHYNPGNVKFNYPDDIWYDGQLRLSFVRNLSIRTFLESSYDFNTLWIGSNEGLFRIDRAHSLMYPVTIPEFSEEQTTPVYHLCEDEKGMIWMGTGRGLVRLNPKGNRVRLFPSGLTGADGNTEPRVCFVHSSKGNIWILTPNTIASLDQETGEFRHIRYNQDPLDESIEMVFPSILEDAVGNFWIAAKNGLNYFNVERFEVIQDQLTFDPPDNDPMEDVRTIISDRSEPDKFLWIGTGTGVFGRLDIKSGKLVDYTVQDGLAKSAICGMLSDSQGNIWISTNNGLLKFDISNKEFTKYSTADGLQSNEFNRGAYYKNHAGELFFGGINGYNCFFPSSVISRAYIPPVVFTGFRLYDNNHEIVAHSSFNVRESNQLKLPYNQNHFTIDFASLDFAFPENNRFAFSMTRSGESWIQTGNERSVTFTELKPGDYTLRIKGTNSDGIWSNKEAVLAIIIESPWWQKSWAYLLYFFIFAGALYSMRKYELGRLKLRNQMRIGSIETKKLKELDQLKSQFFANVSHEFRTPLTLIKGPLEDLMDNNTDPEKTRTFQLMHNHTSKLQGLINQILDLARIESGNYVVKASRGDIVGFIEGLALSFDTLAEKKGIILGIDTGPGLDRTETANRYYYDPDILEKIVINLISNAFKYTPENGRITVRIAQISDHDGMCMLEISIEDTGIGIPADQLPHVFDRFYQGEGSNTMNQVGSGIGLAFVHELAGIHGCKIHVESQVGSGTVFILRIPEGKKHLAPDQIRGEEHTHEAYRSMSNSHRSEKNTPVRPGILNEKEGKPWILIVEDQLEVRQYIEESIQNEFLVMMASNAADGLQMAEEFIPDLIVSDIMMPEMDGCEFCEKIKISEKTSHIPVILLTAMAEINDRIKGLEIGADDYLTKPFNAKELRVRISNLVHSRKVLRQKFTSNSIIHPGEILVSSRDKDMMEKWLGVVQRNIDNVDFSVEDLGRETGMSQSQLHRKLKAIVDMSANQFIRSVRMHRAMELLQKGVGNIGEVAYRVGYDDPGYFSKSFRKFFDKLPSEVTTR